MSMPAMKQDKNVDSRVSGSGSAVSGSGRKSPTTAHRTKESFHAPTTATDTQSPASTRVP